MTQILIALILMMYIIIGYILYWWWQDECERIRGVEDEEYPGEFKESAFFFGSLWIILLPTYLIMNFVDKHLKKGGDNHD